LGLVKKICNIFAFYKKIYEGFPKIVLPKLPKNAPKIRHKKPEIRDF